MRARDLARTVPLVEPGTDAVQAAYEMVRAGLPGVVVVQPDGRPYAVLRGPEVLRFLLPDYLCDEPGLAAAVDEQRSQAVFSALAGRTVRDVVPRRQGSADLPAVDGDDTPLVVAAVMARHTTPLVAVVEGGTVVGAVTVQDLLDAVLPGTA